MLIAMGEQDASEFPSRVQVNAARPDVLSDAEPLKTIGLVNQPFDPVVPVNVPETVGTTVSTLAFRVPINDVSAQEESAQ